MVGCNSLCLLPDGRESELNSTEFSSSTHTSSSENQYAYILRGCEDVRDYTNAENYVGFHS